MQLPREGSSYLAFASFGRYTARRLKQGGYAQLARDVLASATKVRVAGRAWDDADDSYQDALADRDAADDTLDLAAQTTRAALAGRSAQADREEPYTLIFPNGVGEYTAAPIDEEVTRYGQLVTRLEANLAANDPVRKSSVKALKESLRDFKAALESLDNAEQEATMTRNELDRALNAFSRQLEKVYGLLVADQGRARADRFFPNPKTTRTRTARPAGPVDDPDPPTPAPSPDEGPVTPAPAPAPQKASKKG